MQPGDTKLKRLEGRHPGLMQKVDARFDAFATVKAVAAAIWSEYGESISLSAIGNYRCRVWKVRRDHKLKAAARREAWEEFVREGRG